MGRTKNASSTSRLWRFRAYNIPHVGKNVANDPRVSRYVTRAGHVFSTFSGGKYDEEIRDIGLQQSPLSPPPPGTTTTTTDGDVMPMTMTTTLNEKWHNVQCGIFLVNGSMSRKTVADILLKNVPISHSCIRSSYTGYCSTVPQGVGMLLMDSVPESWKKRLRTFRGTVFDQVQIRFLEDARQRFPNDVLTLTWSSHPERFFSSAVMINPSSSSSSSITAVGIRGGAKKKKNRGGVYNIQEKEEEEEKEEVEEERMTIIMDEQKEKKKEEEEEREKMEKEMVIIRGGNGGGDVDNDNAASSVHAPAAAEDIVNNSSCPPKPTQIIDLLNPEPQEVSVASPLPQQQFPPPTPAS